jgi:hypothetical protein
MRAITAYLGVVRVDQAQVEEHQTRVWEGVCRHFCEMEVGVSGLKVVVGG